MDRPSSRQVYYLGLWRKKCRKAFWLAQGCRLTPSTLDITMCVRPIPTVTPTQSHHTGFPAMDLTGFKQISLTFNMAHLKSKNWKVTLPLLENKTPVECTSVIIKNLHVYSQLVHAHINMHVCICAHVRARAHTVLPSKTQLCLRFNLYFYRCGTVQSTTVKGLVILKK
jgi:hypothetical protein